MKITYTVIWKFNPGIGGQRNNMIIRKASKAVTIPHSPKLQYINIFVKFVS